MITKEQTRDFIDRAFKIAKEHGFHDVKLSVEHMMMLVLSEIGEAVEADRRNIHANLHGFDICKGLTYNDRFKNYVKDSVEDEMADVCIRLFDTCGALGIEPTDGYASYNEIRDGFSEEASGKSFCERSFILSSVICHADVAVLDDTDVAGRLSMQDVIGAALCFLFFMADDMGFNLARHIELKMEYNETRPKRHGKKY